MTPAAIPGGQVGRLDGRWEGTGSGGSSTSSADVTVALAINGGQVEASVILEPGFGRARRFTVSGPIDGSGRIDRLRGQSGVDSIVVSGQVPNLQIGANWRGRLRSDRFNASIAVSLSRQ